MTPRYVLLHGFTGAPSSFEGVLRALPACGVALLPTLAGHGGPRSCEASSFDGEVDRLAALMRASRVAPAHVCGYSLGARVALGLALRHAELVETLTLIGVHPGLESPAERRDRLESDARWISLLETRGIATFADAWAAQPLFETHARLPPELRNAEGRRRLNHDAGGLAHALRVLGLAAMPNYRPELGAVRAPLELLAGKLDEKFVRIAEGVLGKFASARLSVVADAGHNLLLERPRAVAEALERQRARTEPLAQSTPERTHHDRHA
jgi:2-succinyl-6-hydroxy-2,4-cyclohexadiene-1-carboxylate synthase